MDQSYQRLSAPKIDSLTQKHDQSVWVCWYTNFLQVSVAQRSSATWNLQLQPWQQGKVGESSLPSLKLMGQPQNFGTHGFGGLMFLCFHQTETPGTDVEVIWLYRPIFRHTHTQRAYRWLHALLCTIEKKYGCNMVGYITMNYLLVLNIQIFSMQTQTKAIYRCFVRYIHLPKQFPRTITSRKARFSKDVALGGLSYSASISL